MGVCIYPAPTKGPTLRRALRIERALVPESVLYAPFKNGERDDMQNSQSFHGLHRELPVRVRQRILQPRREDLTHLRLATKEEVIRNCKLQGLFSW